MSYFVFQNIDTIQGPFGGITTTPDSPFNLNSELLENQEAFFEKMHLETIEDIQIESAFIGPRLPVNNTGGPSIIHLLLFAGIAVVVLKAKF